MIAGIGTDIAETQIFEKTSTDAFIIKAFTENEIRICFSGPQKSSEKLAGRYAAKEAFIKAISPYLFFKISPGDYRNIEILKLQSGAPSISLTGRIKDVATGAGIQNMWVSISHEKNLAVAMVVLEN
ncbi:MAG: holo-ACP synthase [Deltaproteobacteria bacterium]|nr:holo-ACP synthase [Deltaproteobacteria bacterium]